MPKNNYICSMQSSEVEQSPKYSALQALSKSKTKFRRYTGLKWESFDIIVLIIGKYELQSK
jgi:hypothetical protein